MSDKEMKEVEDKPQIVKTFENFLLPLRLLFDKDVTIGIKLLPTAIFLIYLILPTDFISDFIPLIGGIDDLAVLSLCSYMLVQLTPETVLMKYKQSKPKTTAPADSTPTTKIIDVATKSIK